MSLEYEKISREQIDACVAREGIKEDERIDPADGLPHCIRCGERTAIVKWHPARKHELMLAGCMCKCKRDEEQRYREEDAKRERKPAFTGYGQGCGSRWAEGFCVYGKERSASDAWRLEQHPL